MVAEVVLAAILLVSVDALAVDVSAPMSPADKRAHYDAVLTRSGCRHGHTGGAIFSLGHDDHMEPFRSFLAEREETVSHSWPHLRMVATRWLRPDSLQAAFDHEHTRHIEPNCIVKRDLPTPSDPKATAQIYEGSWVTKSRPKCKLTITAMRPWSTTTSVGNLTGWAPKHATLTSDCNGETDVAIAPAQILINMTSLNHGYIFKMSDARDKATKTTNATVTDSGTIVVDPMASLEDQIFWGSGAQWTRVSAGYDKESDIGPDLKDGVETRNYDASPRWNWGLDRIDGQSAALDDKYEFGEATGNGSVLYHLDTGVMASHDDFGGRVYEGYSSGCPTGYEKTCTTEGWIKGGILTPYYVQTYLPSIGVTLEDHGTHTCSTALGNKYGVAKQATGYAVQVLDSSGSGSTVDVIDGMVWAVVHHNQTSMQDKPSVISMSLGMDQRSKVLSMATKAANTHGILVVVAAGNDATDACEESPASVPEALTVAASGISDHVINRDGTINTESWDVFDSLASFSNYGPCVNIIAPGQEIVAAYSSDGSTHLTAALDGTSMATPLVAGVALTIRGLHPTLSPADVTRSLRCVAQMNVVGGKYYNPYTANEMLQGGSRITTEWSTLIADQQELTVEQQKSGLAGRWDTSTCHKPVTPVQEEADVPTTPAAHAPEEAASPTVRARGAAPASYQSWRAAASEGKREGAAASESKREAKWGIAAGRRRQRGLVPPEMR